MYNLMRSVDCKSWQEELELGKETDQEVGTATTWEDLQSIWSSSIYVMEN